MIEGQRICTCNYTEGVGASADPKEHNSWCEAISGRRWVVAPELSESRFVITGTGRSGTCWASEVLGVGHQAMFTGDGFTDTGAEGDCSFWAASQDLTGWRVVLLVRDPRYVVASWLNTGEFDRMLGNGYWRLWQHCMRLDPGILDWSAPADRIERYWYTVNRQMAERADVVLKLEDMVPAQLAHAVDYGYTQLPRPESDTRPVDKIGDHETRLLAREFGYDI